jgi:Tfp pilus assembly protein PilE
MQSINQKGITILSLIILVLIVGGAVIYAPRAYNYVLDQNVRRIVPLCTLCTISSFDTHYLYRSFVPLAYYFII